MAGRRQVDVIIAGAGPAGLATALYLLRTSPALANRIIAIERSRHPRPKVCAGGLIPKTLLALDELGIALDIPAVEVLRGEARTPAGSVELETGEVLCTVIRRSEFDDRLARAARELGLEIIENCRVLGVEQDRNGVRITTDEGCFEGEVLIGADGSTSRVRKAVFGPRKESVGHAVMTEFPVDAAGSREFAESLYRFDFRCVEAGVSGYAWSFACLVDGQPHLNVGVYNQHPLRALRGAERRSAMVDALIHAFSDLPLAGLERRPGAFKSFPIRWFEAGQHFVRGRVLLAGDAAGADPLMGEGISWAFEHGKLAAGAVSRFLQGDETALDDYDRELHEGSIGRKLRKLGSTARRLYGPYYRSFFHLAHLSRNAQRIAVDWYNGAGHTDEIRTGLLLARWAGRVLFGTLLGR